jgi:hypothetical protein
MEIPIQREADARRRYSAMERNAGVTLLVVLAASVASSLVLTPRTCTVLGSLGAGGLTFLCWQAVLAGHQRIALACAIAAVGLGLFAVSAEVERPLSQLLLVGLSLVAVGLYLPIVVTRELNKGRSHGA